MPYAFSNSQSEIRNLCGYWLLTLEIKHPPPALLDREELDEELDEEPDETVMMTVSESLLAGVPSSVAVKVTL